MSDPELPCWGCPALGIVDLFYLHVIFTRASSLCCVIGKIRTTYGGNAAHVGPFAACVRHPSPMIGPKKRRIMGARTGVRGPVYGNHIIIKHLSLYTNMRVTHKEAQGSPYRQD
jgi:hypothetical protein